MDGGGGGGGGSFTNGPGRISSIMSALWGRSLLPASATAPSSSSSPPPSLSAGQPPRGQPPRGRAEPLEDSFLLTEAKAEETAGPRSRGSSYL